MLVLAVMSVSCSLVVTYWERADLLALLYMMFSCVFVTFPYGVLGQVWYMIVSILIFAFFLTLKTLLQQGISMPVSMVIWPINSKES